MKRRKDLMDRCDAVTKPLFFGVLKCSGVHDFNVKGVETYNFDTLRVKAKCNNCGKLFKIYIGNDQKINKSTLLNGDIEVDPNDNPELYGLKKVN